MLVFGKKLATIINNRTTFLKFKRRRRKLLTYKIRNKRWKPWPRRKRRLRKFFEKRILIKKWGNFTYYKNIYRFIDGIYNSFWMGKLAGSFIKKGKKAMIEKQISKLVVCMKTESNYSALELILDSIEQVKPIINVSFYVKSGRRIDYPVFLTAEKRRRIGLQNIIKLIKHMDGRQQLHQKIADGLVDFVTITKKEKHDLIFNRDDIYRQATVRGEDSLKEAFKYFRR